MQRRDLFNILFKSNIADGLVVPEPDPVLETPSYLLFDKTEYSSQEWNAVPEEEIFTTVHSAQYAFTVTFEAKSTDQIVPSGQKPILTLYLGIKDNQETKGMGGIPVGLNASGNLFIGNQYSERLIETKHLLEGIQLVVEVSPQGNGGSYAKIKIVDRCGLTLSVLKSNAYSILEWTGNISCKGFEPPLCFNLLRIEGRCTN